MIIPSGFSCLALVLGTSMAPTQVTSQSIMPWDWSQGQWIDNTETMARFASYWVPQIGGVLSFTLSVVWPEGEKDDSWSQMFTQVKSLIDEKIVENNQATLNGKIEAIHLNIKDYVNAVSDKARGEWMTQTISACQDAYATITNWDEKQYVPWMVQLSSLHLQVLRERYLFGEQFYGQKNDFWKTDLQAHYDTYTKWFEDWFPQWEDWRLGKIHGSSEKQGIEVKDRLTGTKVSICWTPTSKLSCSKSAPEPDSDGHGNKITTGQMKDGTVQVMKRELRAQMLSTVTPTFHLWCFLPWLVEEYGAYGPPILPSYLPEEIKLGPYASWGGHIVGLDHHSWTTQDEPGMAISASGGSWNSVDRFQINYMGHNGDAVQKTGGKDYFVNFDAKAGHDGSYLQGMLIDFWYYQAASILGKFSLYINPNNGEDVIEWAVPKGKSGQGTVNITMGPWYQVTTVAQLKGRGPSKTFGTIAMEVTMMHNHTAKAKYDPASRRLAGHVVQYASGKLMMTISVFVGVSALVLVVFRVGLYSAWWSERTTVLRTPDNEDPESARE